MVINIASVNMSSLFASQSSQTGDSTLVLPEICFPQVGQGLIKKVHVRCDSHGNHPTAKKAEKMQMVRV